MKLLRYGPSGHENPGLLDGNGTIRDLSGIVGDIGRETLLPESLERLRAIDPATLPKVPGTPRIGPCVSQVGKFICIGLNYSDHAAESGMAVPKEPIVFMKATSASSARTMTCAAARIAEDATGKWSSASSSASRRSTSKRRMRCRMSPATASSTISPSVPISSRAPGSGSKARAPIRSARSGRGW